MLFLFLTLVAIALNKEDLRLVLFCLLVACTKYLPLHLVTDYYMWYSVCILVESLVIVYCLKSKFHVSFVLLPITSLLLFSHLANLLFFKRESYVIIANTLEHMQILTFIISSHPIITKIKERMKCLMKSGCGF